MPTKRNKLTALAAGVAAIPLLAARTALAQGNDLFAQGEQIGSGMGRAGAAILGPVIFVVACIMVIAGLWHLFGAGNRNNQGRGLYGTAILGIIAGCCMAGYIGFVAMGSRTFTGGAPTASTAPLVLR